MASTSISPKTLTTKEIGQIFQLLAEHNAEPLTELHFINDFTLLVSIILSAQSTDAQVNRVTEHLFKLVRSPEELLNLGLEPLKQQINSLGLYNNKAKNLLKLSEVLIQEYHSTVPVDRDVLKTLPGVGQKTANVFLNVAYHQPFIGVDTHVTRLSYRLGFLDHPEKNPTKIEAVLNQLVPEQWKDKVNHWFVLHGRYICQAKKPDCLHCFLNRVCKQNLQAEPIDSSTATN